jgi:hypothetical protein
LISCHIPAAIPKAKPSTVKSGSVFNQVSSQYPGSVGKTIMKAMVVTSVALWNALAIPERSSRWGSWSVTNLHLARSGKQPAVSINAA